MNYALTEMPVVPVIAEEEFEAELAGASCWKSCCNELYACCAADKLLDCNAWPSSVNN